MCRNFTQVYAKVIALAQDCWRAVGQICFHVTRRKMREGYFFQDPGSTLSQQPFHADKREPIQLKFIFMPSFGVELAAASFFGHPPKENKLDYCTTTVHGTTS